MTREKIIKYLNIIKAFFLGSEHQPISDAYFALDEAIKALEQEPCEDCISRKAVENITWEEPSYTDALNVLTEVREKVRELPSVTPQSKTGHWIVDRKTFRINLRGKQEFGYSTHCDKCNYHCDFTTDAEGSLPSKFCPNCGTKMEGYEV